MTTPRRTALAIFAVLAALLLCAGLAAAQEPDEAEGGTRLEPGVNLVGWVGEATYVSQLFREIPRLEAIWAWDAELRDWVVAALGAPEWLGGLGRVTAGMGLRMQLGGDQPYLWQRSTEPTRGLVKLRTGWNLVAWSGAGGAAIGDVVKGIGWSLRTVRRWDAANQQWGTWTSPERSAQVIANTGADTEIPGIRRGEALWIEVARAVNWLQPTDILPRLVFPGGASQQLQARVREDLRATLSFFRDQYGIQAEADFTIYAAKDADALIQAYKDDGREVDVDLERSRWERLAGYASWRSRSGRTEYRVWLKQSNWPDGLSADEITQARYSITHEYFHVLQHQQSHHVDVQWLVEGTADWAEGQHEVLDGGEAWSDLRDSVSSAINNDTPTLRSTESPNARWEYRLGWLATDRLTRDAGADSWIEFWRQFAPTEIGPHRRWESTPDWRTVFHGVFGQSVSEFYSAFDVWQRGRAAANPSTANSYDGNWIRGQVTDKDDNPVAGVFVNAIRVEGETSVGWNQRAETGDDGAFAVRAPEDGDYRLSVDDDDDCTGYYRHGDLVAEEETSQPIQVAGADVLGIKIQTSESVCGWYIRGQVVGPNAEPLTGMSIRHCDIAMNRCFLPHSTALDGSFAIPITASVSYRLRLDLADGCSVYYGASQVAIDRDEATPITIVDGYVRGLLLRMPEGTCLYQIRGHVVRADGQPLADLSVRICPVEQSHCEWERTDTDGTFAIIAPLESEYRLTLRLSDDGCDVHYRQAGLTLAKDGAFPISVRGDDVVGVQMLVPTGMCAYQIKGSITQADGQPLTDARISACLEVDGDCVSRLGSDTDDRGAFAITVPTEGSYRLSFNLEGCTVYFAGDGLTTDWQTPYTVRIEGRGLRMNPRQIPEGMCAHRISGRFVDASGAPLSEKWINAFGPGGSGGVWTKPDGAFEIRVPSDGAYSFGIQLSGEPYCWYNLAGRPFGSPNNPVRVQGADVADVVLRLPGTIEELCG